MQSKMWRQPFGKHILKSVEDRFLQFPENRLLLTKAVSASLHKQTGKRQAAVLVPLCNQNNIPSVVLTLRTQTVGTHKGQVSFPGGHIDAGETAADAALRELNEELGLDPKYVRILGQAQTVPAITGTLVTPIIGFIEKDVEDLSLFTHSKNEVEQVFSRSIEQLLSPGFRYTERLTRNGISIDMPSFGPKDDPQRIWGLTAMILDGVLQQLIIPSVHGPVVPNNV